MKTSLQKRGSSSDFCGNEWRMQTLVQQNQTRTVQDLDITRKNSLMTELYEIRGVAIRRAAGAEYCQVANLIEIHLYCIYLARSSLDQYETHSVNIIIS